MTTILERAKAAMDSLSPAVPYAMDVYEGDLPDLFFVYHVFMSLPEYNADNVEAARSHYVQVSLFDSSGLLNLSGVDAAMKAQGFTKSVGRQIPKSQTTGHYGYAQDYIFLEFNL